MAQVMVQEAWEAQEVAPEAWVVLDLVAAPMGWEALVPEKVGPAEWAALGQAMVRVEVDLEQVVRVTAVLEPAAMAWAVWAV